MLMLYKLIKLHFGVIITNKLLVIILINIGLMIAMLLYCSNFYLPRNELLMHKEMYYIDYAFESISFLKIVIIISIIFIVLSMKSIERMDMLLLNFTSKKKLIISRILSILILSGILSIIMMLFYVIIGMFLTPYDMEILDTLQLICSVLLFAFYYSLISVLVYLYSNHVYSLAGVLLFHIIGTTLNGSLLIIEEMSLFQSVLNIFLNDLLLFSSFKMGFLFGNYYVLALIIALFAISVKKYNGSDILN